MKKYVMGSAIMLVLLCGSLAPSASGYYSDADFKKKLAEYDRLVEQRDFEVETRAKSCGIIEEQIKIKDRLVSRIKEAIDVYYNRQADVSAKVEEVRKTKLRDQLERTKEWQEKYDKAEADVIKLNKLIDEMIQAKKLSDEIAAQKMLRGYALDRQKVAEDKLRALDTEIKRVIEWNAGALIRSRDEAARAWQGLRRRLDDQNQKLADWETYLVKKDEKIARKSEEIAEVLKEINELLKKHGPSYLKSVIAKDKQREIYYARWLDPQDIRKEQIKMLEQLIDKRWSIKTDLKIAADWARRDMKEAAEYFSEVADVLAEGIMTSAWSDYGIELVDTSYDIVKAGPIRGWAVLANKAAELYVDGKLDSALEENDMPSDRVDWAALKKVGKHYTIDSLSNYGQDKLHALLDPESFAEAQAKMAEEIKDLTAEQIKKKKSVSTLKELGAGMIREGLKQFVKNEIKRRYVLENEETVAEADIDLYLSVREHRVLTRAYWIALDRYQDLQRIREKWLREPLEGRRALQVSTNNAIYNFIDNTLTIILAFSSSEIGQVELKVGGQTATKVRDIDKKTSEWTIQVSENLEKDPYGDIPVEVNAAFKTNPPVVIDGNPGTLAIFKDGAWTDYDKQPDESHRFILGYGRSIMLVVDSSGSMKEGDKLDRAREEVLKFIEVEEAKDTKNNEYALYVFRDAVDARLLCPFTRDIEWLQENLEKLTPGRASPIARSIQYAERIIKLEAHFNNQIIFLFSDDKDTCKGDPKKARKESTVKVELIKID